MTVLLFVSSRNTPSSESDAATFSTDKRGFQCRTSRRRPRTVLLMKNECRQRRSFIHIVALVLFAIVDQLRYQCSRCDTKKLLFRKSQPIRSFYGFLDIEIQVIEKESTNCKDFYPVVDWTTINVAKKLKVIVQRIGRS